MFSSKLNAKSLSDSHADSNREPIFIKEVSSKQRISINREGFLLENSEKD